MRDPKAFNDSPAAKRGLWVLNVDRRRMYMGRTEVPGRLDVGMPVQVDVCLETKRWC